MKKLFTLSILGAGVAVALSGFAQVPGTLKAVPMPTSASGQTMTKIIKKKLPDDLPQEKLLFVKYAAVPLAPNPPKGWGMERRKYFMQKNHNEVFPEANKQLTEAAAKYPFAHRITTLDSVAYYQEHGYKYMLMQSSFNSAVDGTFIGTTGHGSGANRTYASTSVDLYVQDLKSGDKYVFDDFSETFIYYYKGQVGMLLKKVDKQFDAKKKG